MAVKEVGNISAEPEIKKLTISNATDDTKSGGLEISDNSNLIVSQIDNLIVQGTDAATFVQIQRSGATSDDTNTGLSLGVNGNDGYIYNRSGVGKLYFASSNSVAITIDASENATFVANLSCNGGATLGDAAADTHVVNGTLRLASEHSSGPSAPADGDGGILYVKNDGKLYFISQDVTETDLTDGGGGGDLTIVTTSSATYALSTYNTMVIVDSSSNAVEVDLPTASGNAGKTVDILAKTGTTNAVTIDPNGSETINGVSTSYILNVNYANLTLVSDGSNWVIR